MKPIISRELVNPGSQKPSALFIAIRREWPACADRIIAFMGNGCDLRSACLACAATV